MDQDLEDSVILDYYNCTGQNEFINLTTANNITITTHAALVGIFICLGLVGNLTVLILVLKDKRLRQRSILASLNMVSVDILLTIFYHGVILTNTLSRDWSYEGYTSNVQAVCKLYGSVTTFLIDVRWCTIALLTLDRFLTVKFPFRYERHSLVFLLLTILLSWLIPLVFSSLLATPVVGYTFRANIPTCLPSCLNVSHSSACRLLNTGIIVLMFIIGCLLPSLLYVWMYRKARQLKAKYTLGEFAVTITTSIAVTHMLSTYSERDNRNNRAMITTFLIFLTIFFTSVPQFFFFILRQGNICAFFRTPIEVHFIVTDIFLLSTTLDPIVLMRNRDFRTVFYDIIHNNVLCRAHHVSDHRSQLPLSSSTVSRNTESVTSIEEMAKESSKSLFQSTYKETHL